MTRTKMSKMMNVTFVVVVDAVVVVAAAAAVIVAYSVGKKLVERMMMKLTMTKKVKDY